MAVFESSRDMQGAEDPLQESPTFRLDMEGAVDSVSGRAVVEAMLQGKRVKDAVVRRGRETADDIG